MSGTSFQGKWSVFRALEMKGLPAPKADSLAVAGPKGQDKCPETSGIPTDASEVWPGGWKWGQGSLLLTVMQGAGKPWV